jgi:hypothetical protein
MTKQFLSESISYLDYIIFAVAPIGIITTVVSTIRLSGSTALRAFIGRSQEGQGAVEAELCTSTSRDVCELFTRGGIQRVLGRPSILELVYLPQGTPWDGIPGLGPKLIPTDEYFRPNSKYVKANWHVAFSPFNRKTLFAPHLNLSLNIGIRRPD